MLRPTIALVVASTLLPACVPEAEVMTTLSAYLAAREAEVPAADRLDCLRPLAEAIAAHAGDVDLLFICTHNSRRSHFAQIWAQTAARRYGLDGVRTFSGGTEATAFHPNAVAALERAGFGIGRAEDELNPVYVVVADDGRPMECFSKAFSDRVNPQDGFVAVMTCSDADEACPFVPGAASRFAIAYRDPKVSDGTPEEAATYDARCADIAREMVWVMRTVAELRRGS